MFVFFGGLLVLVLFAALIGPYFVDWSSYRHDFEREAGRILGQKVSVMGRADARLLPFPSVTFEDVVVGEGRHGEPMMAIERFSMDAELAPFLSGEILIFDMRIEKPTVTVRLSTDGALDWALRNDKVLSETPLVLENITVTDGQVLIVDDQNGREHLLKSLDMNMSAKSILGPWHMEGTADLNDHKGGFSITAGAPHDDGSIRLRARLQPDSLPFSIEMDGDARIEKLKPQYRGNFTVQALNPSPPKSGTVIKGSRRKPATYVKAQGVFEVDNERLRIDDYRLETGSANDPYIISGEATFDTGRNPEFLLIADGQQLNMSRMDSDEDGGQIDGRYQSLEQRLASVRRLLSALPVPQMPGKVAIGLPAIVTGDTTVRDVVIDAQPKGPAWEIKRLEAKLPGRTLFEAQGLLGVGAEFGFSGTVTVASRQPSGFASWLTSSVDPAIRRLEAAGMSAQVDLSTRLQRFDALEIAVGTAFLKGRLERSVPIQGRPSLFVELEGAEVDADALKAFVGLVIGDGQANRLAGHDVDARLSAGRFSGLGVTARDAKLNVRLKGGTLDIDQFTVNDLSGASITSVGHLESIFDGPRGDVDITVMSERSGPALALLSELAGDHPLLNQLRDNAVLFDETNMDIKSRFSPGKQGQTKLNATVKGRTGGSRFSLTLERPDALAPLDTSTISLKGDVTNNSPGDLLEQMGIKSLPVDLSGPAKLDVNIEGIPAEDVGFSIVYKAPDTEFSARGSGRQDENRALQGHFKLELESQDLSPYLSMNGINLIDLGFGLPAKFEADISTDAEHYTLSGMRGYAGDVTFSGDLSLARGSDIAAISGSIDVSQVDMAWLGETMLGAGTVLSSQTGWSEVEFLQPLQGGLELDVDVKASSARFHVAPDARNLSGKLVLKDNELQWRNLVAEWFGGDLAGHIALANRDATALWSGQFQLKDADLQTMVWKRDGFAIAAGDLDLSASFEGAGKSMRAIIASLTGSGILETRGLEIEGLENESLPQILSASDDESFALNNDSVSEMTARILSNGSFYADALTVPFTMAAGTIRMPNIVLEDAGASVRGGVRIDLVDEAVNARFDLEFDAEEDALSGSAPALGLIFLGPIAEPARTLDVTELNNYLSMRAYERERRRVEILQAIVLENQRMRREASLAVQQDHTRREAAAERKRQEEERAAYEKLRLQQEMAARAEAQRAARLAAEEAALEAREAERKAREENRMKRLIADQQRAAQAYANSLVRQRPRRPGDEDDFLRQLEEAVSRAGEQDQVEQPNATPPIAPNGNTGSNGSVIRLPLPKERGTQTGDTLPTINFDALNN